MRKRDGDTAMTVCGRAQGDEAEMKSGVEVSSSTAPHVAAISGAWARKSGRDIIYIYIYIPGQKTTD